MHITCSQREISPSKKRRGELRSRQPRNVTGQTSKSNNGTNFAREILAAKMEEGVPKLRIAVVGAGIAGLCATIALQKRDGIEIRIYERASRLQEVGLETDSTSFLNVF